MIEAVAIISGRYLARNINLGGDPLRHLFQSLFNSPSNHSRQTAHQFINNSRHCGSSGAEQAG
jgi:hypothetical protein